MVSLSQRKRSVGLGELDELGQGGALQGADEPICTRVHISLVAQWASSVPCGASRTRATPPCPR